MELVMWILQAYSLRPTHPDLSYSCHAPLCAMFWIVNSCNLYWLSGYNKIEHLSRGSQHINSMGLARIYGITAFLINMSTYGLSQWQRDCVANETHLLLLITKEFKLIEKSLKTSRLPHANSPSILWMYKSTAPWIAEIGS